jgi:hypothetical protein
MPATVYLSTAYLPPSEYFAAIADYDEVLIEREENYLKQSYRNRCYILSSNGIQLLSVPVLAGNLHKTPVRDLRIDYSKRWQQVHLGAIKSAYGSSPFFLYYFETIQTIILENHLYILDLNMKLLMAILRLIRLDKKISFTDKFKPPVGESDDLRYRISPKKSSLYKPGKYQQVFNQNISGSWKLSIIDILFNAGPETKVYL